MSGCLLGSASENGHNRRGKKASSEKRSNSYVSVVMSLEEQRLVSSVKNQGKTKQHYRAPKQIRQRNPRDGIFIIQSMSEKFNAMENWIPGHKGPCVGRQLKSSEKQTRGENKNPINYPFNKLGDELIKVTQENKADPKTYCHQNCQ
tara:strand:+ start:501 stop:941 length:441 start_codon:yes stop_codon:yes gene_type:complete